MGGSHCPVDSLGMLDDVLRRELMGPLNNGNPPSKSRLNNGMNYGLDNGSGSPGAGRRAKASPHAPDARYQVHISLRTSATAHAPRVFPLVRGYAPAVRRKTNFPFSTWGRTPPPPPRAMMGGAS